MIGNGLGCPHDSATGECQQIARYYNPKGVLCWICEGKGSEGCEGCHGQRIVKYPCLHAEITDANVFQVIRLAGLMNKGFLPSSGGVLDQTQWFLQACEFIWSDQRRIEQHQTEQAESKNTQPSNRRR